MATKTAGTPASTSLTAVQYWPDPTDLLPADLATVAQGIWEDGGYGCPPAAQRGNGNKIGTILPGAFVTGGRLYLPGGRSPAGIAVYPGDWVAVDSFGNVVVIPQRAMPKTLTASVTLASGSPTVTSTTDIRTYGWQVGTHVTSSHTPSNSVIGSIAPGGLSFTLANTVGAAVNATGSATETMTAGTWTHS